MKNITRKAFEWTLMGTLIMLMMSLDSLSTRQLFVLVIIALLLLRIDHVKRQRNQAADGAIIGDALARRYSKDLRDTIARLDGENNA